MKPLLFIVGALSFPLLVHASESKPPFTLIYEETAIPQSLIKQLEKLLDRKVVQSPLNNDTLLDEAEHVDLLLSSFYTLQNIEANISLLAQHTKTSKSLQRWHYTDQELIHSDKFYPYYVNFHSLVINMNMLPPSLINDWSDTWDRQWSQQLAMIDDYRYLYMVVQHQLGYHYHTITKNEAKQITDRFNHWLPNVHDWYEQSDIEVAFLSGKAAIGIMSNTHAYNTELEGATTHFLWHIKPVIQTNYGLSIPKKTLSFEESMLAINFLTKANQVATFANQQRRVPTDNNAYHKLSQQFISSDNLFPSVEHLDNLHSLYKFNHHSSFFKQHYQKAKNRLHQTK